MKDMRAFLDKVEGATPREFIRVKREVDTRYEITALVRKLELEHRYPLLLFEKVKGFSMTIACNLYATRDRLALALDSTGSELVNEYRRREENPAEPKRVDRGPVQEVVTTGPEVDLAELPVITHHTADVSPYITTGIVLAKEPDTGVYNASFGRLMIVNRDTLYTHMTPGRHLEHYYRVAEARGEPLPASISIGTHPSWALGAISSVPIDQDELRVMSAMAGEPVELVKCKTVDVEALAHAEIVLEGELLPGVRGKEGPICEFTGYAIGVRDRNVFKVKAITRRRKPIYQGLIPGSTEHRLLGSISKESHLFKVARRAVPSVVALHIPISGAGRFHCYVSMEKKAKGQPRNVAMAIMGADIYPKHVFVVDHDIDVFDERQILWAVATRVQGDRDLITIPGTMGSDLDPSADEEGVVCKTIIDATAKPFLGQFPERAQVPKEIFDRIKLEEYVGG